MDFGISMFIAIYQSACLFLFFLTVGSIKQRKPFYDINESSIGKMLLGLFIGIFLFLMYLLNISHILAMFMIILPVSMMYLGLGSTLFIYLIVLFGNIVFLHTKLQLLLFYMILILISKCIMLFIKGYIKQLITVYILAIIFLNIELIIFSRSIWEFIIFNIISIIIWLKLLLSTYYFHEENTKYIENQKIAFIDKTTNINNYFCLLNQAEKFLNNKNKNRDISIILFNVDRLKDINQLYGSLCGDMVIKTVGDIIKRNASLYGVVYRLAGDTFCIIAIKEKFSIMQTISEKIRMEIDIEEFIIDNDKVNISVSVGGYHGEIASGNIDDYIELAQQSLFSSKYHGRNRVSLNNQMVYYKT